MLASDKVFSCQLCAAMPINQELQGCFKPARRPNVILQQYVFERCPITYQTKTGNVLVRQVFDGVLTSPYEVKIRTPAKRMAAYHYIDFLKRLREANDY